MKRMSVSSQPSPDDSETDRHSFADESVTDAADNAPSEDTEIAEGTTYEVLSNKRRRYVVYLLKQGSGRIAIGEMAEQVAAWEYNISVQQVMGDQRKRVYTALQQTHLPMMDDADLIGFNKDRGIITPKPAVQGIKVYQESGDEETTPWSEYYMGFASVSVVFWAGSAGGIPPLETVSMSVLTPVFIAILFASSMAHWYQSQHSEARDTESQTTGKPPEVNRQESD